MSGDGTAPIRPEGDTVGTAEPEATDEEQTRTTVQTGSEAVIRALENADVEHAFGVQGGAIMPVYDALYDSEITHVTMAHEQGAVHAATAYGTVRAGRDQPRHRYRGREHGLRAVAGADRAGADGFRR